MLLLPDKCWSKANLWSILTTQWLVWTEFFFQSASNVIQALTVAGFANLQLEMKSFEFFPKLTEQANLPNLPISVKLKKTWNVSKFTF